MTTQPVDSFIVYSKPPDKFNAALARRVAAGEEWRNTKLSKKEWLELADILDGGAASQERRDYFKARL